MAEQKAKTGRGWGRGARNGPMPRLAHPWKLLSRLLKYVFGHYGMQLIVILVSILISVLASAQGTMFMKTLINQYIEPMMSQKNPDFSGLRVAVGRVALFYLIGIIATYIQNRLMVTVSQGTLKRLRNELFSSMERLPIGYFDTHAHGDIMSVYTNDVDTLRQMISQSMMQMVQSFVTVVTIVVMMAVLSIPLTLISLFMVVVTILVSGMASGISGRNFVSQQKNLGTLNGFIEETMAGQKVVKVFCHEGESIQKFDELNEELYQSAYKANAYSNILGPLSSQLGNTSFVLCAFVGSALALNSTFGFTVGALASFLTFNKNFSMPINQLTMQLNAVMMALAGAQRIFELMDEKPEEDAGYVTLVNARKEEDGQLREAGEHTGHWAWKHYHQDSGETTFTELRGDVVFDDVDFGYQEDKPVLHHIALHATPGQKVALVGSTGAGKTTITNLINRFYQIQDGKIRYDHININKICLPDLRRSLGMVLQDTHLFTGTVKENIRFGKLNATDEEVVAAAKLAGADSFIRQLPNGYDSVLQGDGGNLSQGQRQLLAIARAAIADPPVLILDEATSSIDTRTEKIVQDGMDALMKGRTTFVIAHRLSTVRNADCILVMEQGRIIERGTHEELMRMQSRYYQLYTGGQKQSA